MRVRIKDVAERAGVSTTMVSLYLNHHPLSARMAEKTKQRIDEAVRELNYQPSATARSLKKGKSKTLGRHASGVDASGGRCFAFDVPGDGGESARNLFCGFSARSGGGRRERTRRSSRLNDHSGFNETSGPRTESFSYIRVDPAG